MIIHDAAHTRMYVIVKIKDLNKGIKTVQNLHPKTP